MIARTRRRGSPAEGEPRRWALRLASWLLSETRSGGSTMAVTGPVDFLALTFPTHRVDAAVVESVAEVVRHRTHASWIS